MIRVITSSVIPAPVDAVWATIRDFDALPSWVPAIATSRIDDDAPSDRIGCIRHMELNGGGGVVRERLLTLSDHDHRITYTILESPLGVSNYVATLTLTPITDGDATFGQWVAEFDCAPDREAELRTTIGQAVFQAAFDKLKTMFPH